MILRSKYIIDSFGQTIENGAITVNGKRIASIHGKSFGKTVLESDVIDLGYSVLMPGFVNSHTHLELTSAYSQIQQQLRFTDWIREVVHKTGDWTEEAFNSSLREGIRQCIDSGTTSLGDIGQAAKDFRSYLDSGIRVCVFNEVIGFDPRSTEKVFESLKNRISQHPPDEKLHIGIAPHTPYTVSEQLLKKCIKLAHDNDWPLCIHLAETSAELQFLRQGTGEIRFFREEFGLPPKWTPPGVSPVNYLNNLGFFEKPATLIHCNYVNEEDYDIIALSGSSVVFCPRSHQYFMHEEHPFIKMLENGINVALGTDSRISSPTLSILDEMKFVHMEFPELAHATILQMATANGLRALNIPQDVGPLEPGCQADFVGVALPEEEIERFDHPLDAVFSKHSSVIFSMVEGKVLVNIGNRTA